MEWKDIMQEYYGSLLTPKSDVVAAIENGLCALSEQLWDKTKSYKSAKVIRDYLKTSPTSPTGKLSSSI